ncbi:MAG: metallophosphoesterase [Verrucomicrobiales bacterium]|nr:metallophosphoesterase [Verrucomicrobiales bacterium]
MTTNTRRHFLRTSAALAASSGIAIGEEKRHARTLDEAYRMLGFDPKAAGSFTALWMADIHYGIGKTQAILPPIIAEIERMSPRPAFIGIVGDLIVSASHSFGTVPGEKDRALALEEFRALKKHSNELARLAPLKLTLGNHDTYPGESDLGLFRSVFGDTPVTHAFEEKGVAFIIANGGSCGRLGEAQEEWFQKEARRLHRSGGTLVTAIHQPSVGSVVNERGITSAVRRGFEGLRGDLWVIGGHIHTNSDRVLRIPGGERLVNASITAANPTVWGTERPGYWLWCFRDGRLIGRLFRKVADEVEGWRIESPEVTTSEQALLLPFENEPDILWKVLVGEGDDPYRTATKAAWCENYWAYASQLDYRLPLSLANGKAKRCTILAAPMAPKGQTLQINTSADGRTWEPAEPEKKDSRFTLAIPASCLAGGNLHLRLERCAVSGFALKA